MTPEIVSLHIDDVQLSSSGELTFTNDNHRSFPLFPFFPVQVSPYPRLSGCTVGQHSGPKFRDVGFFFFFRPIPPLFFGRNFSTLVTGARFSFSLDSAVVFKLPAKVALRSFPCF